jgi:hypothetical protein
MQQCFDSLLQSASDRVAWPFYRFITRRRWRNLKFRLRCRLANATSAELDKQGLWASALFRDLVLLSLLSTLFRRIQIALPSETALRKQNNPHRPTG